MKTKPANSTRSELKWLLFALLAAALSRAASDAEHDFLLDSPHTEETIAFFKKTNNHLDSTVKKNVRCVLKAQWTTVSFNFSNFDLEDIPEKFVNGMKINAMKLYGDEKNTTASMVMLEKLLQAFENLYVSQLYITDFYFGNSPALGPPGKVVKFEIALLSLKNTADLFIKWLFEVSDLSSCKLNIEIGCSPEVKTLDALDSLVVRELKFLKLYKLLALETLNCKALRENTVTYGLIVANPPKDIEVAPLVVQGMANKHWEVLRVPLWLWKKVALAASNTFLATMLYIDIAQEDNFEYATNTWPAPLATGAPIAALFLMIHTARTNSFTLGIAQGLDLLNYISKSFRMLASIRIEMKVTPEFKEYLKKTRFYISSIPSVVILTIAHTPCKLCTHAAKPSMICIDLDVYPTWKASGLEKTWNPSALDGVDALPPNVQALLTPKEGRILESMCAVCMYTLGDSTDSEQNSEDDKPEQFCLVDKEQHVVCNRCLEQLQGKFCPICRAPISLEAIRYFITRSESGAVAISNHAPDGTIVVLPRTDPEK
ncbi:hypothetical protein NEDG_01074 [Nematocida displodere]|uniref:RING-type domain-containing protein n=1 Tax=Nematocida displodere TaxID=1805483 RepID=A0A177EAJ4_9MICR|nr:hypothetical protein NEDG_01074 [Nematocida displodere]